MRSARRSAIVPGSIASSAVDLSRLPPPNVVEQLSFETIYATNLADLREILPDFDATVKSEPAVKLLQLFSYREMLVRQEFNDRARLLMIAFSTGGDLDHLGAIVGVGRLVLDPGDPEQGIDPTYESDVDLRQRIVLAPESFSVAGPELAYVFHAKTADADVLDASATSPVPGQVVVAVLSRTGAGEASAELIAAVDAVYGRAVRPLGDEVIVQSAEILDFAINATLFTFSGPDTGLVLEAARDRLDLYLAESRRLGRDITLSSIMAALTAAGVQRVALAAPAADVVCSPLQAAHCTAITIAHGGYGN